MQKNKRYYFEKMRQGLITDEEVAKLFNTSVSCVRNAYIDYSKTKNPFCKRDYRVIILIIEVMVSVISVLLVLFTLLEMQVARNNSYIPDVYFNKTTFAVTWDATGLPNPAFLENPLYQVLFSITDYVDEIPSIELTNIGMGTAKHIRLEWQHSDNIRNLRDFLYNSNKEANFQYEIKDNQVVITSNGREIRSTARPFFEIAYMKNEPQSDSITLPYEYIECIRQIFYKYSGNGQFLPDIQIILNYEDIQGKAYCVRKKLRIKLKRLIITPDNEGYAFFELMEV